MAVTIKDVAALAGVSPSTVSRTCKNNPSISTETKEKVRKAMIELGYEVNFQASNLASQYSRTIGIILPASAREVYENAFYLEAIRGISHYCNQRQYMSTVVTGQDEDEILKAIQSMSRSGKVDGFIVLYSRKDDPIIDYLFSEGLLYILIGKATQYTNQTLYIDNDNLLAGEDGPKVEELEEKEINVIHCSPSHHYPTGIVMPISKRYELLGWVTKTKDRYIIEDEYDSELRLNGKPIPSLQSIDVSGKVIYMNTFSKTLCSTVRISYMVLPDELAERFYRELSFYSCTVSNFEQYTLAQFMNSGAFEKHINRLRNYYQQKRDRILEAFLQGVLKTKIQILEEDAGVHFLMKVDTNLSEEEFLDKMKSKGIKLAALSSYYHSSEKKKKYENIYVMNYSFVDCEKMEYVAKMITQVE